MAQREIKFRAFDGVDYVTNPFTLLDIQNGKIQFASSDTVIMQFTGLHDKNGVEIYEGDRCVISDPYEENNKDFTVEYRNGGYPVEWDGMFCGGEADATTIGWAIDCDFVIEVIGNIYEPSLSDHIDKHGGPY